MEGKKKKMKEKKYITKYNNCKEGKKNAKYIVKYGFKENDCVSHVEVVIRHNIPKISLNQANPAIWHYSL